MVQAGLVLEGGGMRGSYTAGVLDAFLDMGLHFNDLTGVSAGACNAISYVSGQFQRNLYIFRNCINRQYLSLWNFLTTGSFFGMRYVFYEVTRHIVPFDYAAFRNSPKRLTCVCTSVADGTPHYHTLRDLEEERDMRYLCATAAIPLASTIVQVDGKRLMDGGASDSIPIAYSLQKGNRKNVLVLTRNEGYHMRDRHQWLPYVRYPFDRAFARQVANRAAFYNESIDLAQQQERDGNAIIIRPSLPIIAGRMEKDPAKLEAQYRVGYEDALRLRNALLEFVSDCDNVQVNPP